MNLLQAHNLVIQPLCAPPTVDASNSLYMLREDLIPFSFGGNKVRIAWEFVADMRARGKDALVMYGDRQSNLCRVLANLCHIERIPCVMVATVEAESVASFNAQLVDFFGVPVIECSKDGIADAVDHALELLRAQGRDPYYIFGSRLGTGNEATAVNAYARVYDQIAAWENAHGLHFDAIACAVGTGSTYGGLIAGSIAARTRRTILGISISSRSPERATQAVRTGVCSWLEGQRIDIPPELDEFIHVSTDYNLGGYGRSNKQVEDLIAWMLKNNSTPLDPTYTGKAFLGLTQMLADQNIRESKILFVHTGGLPLFFDHLNSYCEK